MIWVRLFSKCLCHSACLQHTICTLQFELELLRKNAMWAEWHSMTGYPEIMHCGIDILEQVLFSIFINTVMRNDIFCSVIGSSNHGSSFMRLDGNKASSSMSLPSTRRAGTPSSYSQIPSVQDIEITLESVAINRKSVTIGEVILEGKFLVVNEALSPQLNNVPALRSMVLVD